MTYHPLGLEIQSSLVTKLEKGTKNVPNNSKALFYNEEGLELPKLSPFVKCLVTLAWKEFFQLIHLSLKKLPLLRKVRYEEQESSISESALENLQEFERKRISLQKQNNFKGLRPLFLFTD